MVVRVGSGFHISLVRIFNEVCQLCCAQAKNCQWTQIKSGNHVSQWVCEVKASFPLDIRFTIISWSWEKVYALAINDDVSMVVVRILISFWPKSVEFITFLKYKGDWF